MAQRLQLHKLLLELVGSNNVYFQPPEDLKMQYPCIVYSIDRIHGKHADNTVYGTEDQYLITVIDPDPDSSIRDKVSQLPRSFHDRHYTSSNLNHDVFTIIY